MGSISLLKNYGDVVKCPRFFLVTCLLSIGIVMTTQDENSTKEPQGKACMASKRQVKKEKENTIQ